MTADTRAPTECYTCATTRRRRTMKSFQPRGMPVYWCQAQAPLAKLRFRRSIRSRLSIGQRSSLYSMTNALRNVKDRISQLKKTRPCIMSLTSYCICAFCNANHFSGPSRAIDWVSVCVRKINFELDVVNDRWPIYTVDRKKVAVHLAS